MYKYTMYACIFIFIVWTLYFAIRRGHDKIVEVLTKLGADVNHVNEVSYHHSVL